MRKTILFDLDGTLLQMDNDDFLRRYTEVIEKYFNDLGYDTKTFLRLYNSSFYKMLNNDGSVTNEEIFYQCMDEAYPDRERLRADLNSFFNSTFSDIQTIVNKDNYPALLINELKRRGYKLILATNPFFPKICTYGRIKWAGLNPEDFSYVSTYENSSYCKPNVLYFNDLIERLSLDPNDLIMIGNDIDDDFLNLPEGIEGILIDDYLINRHNKKPHVKVMKLKDLYLAIKNMD